jgi:hypothetical protein
MPTHFEAIQIRSAALTTPIRSAALTTQIRALLQVGACWHLALALCDTF